MGVRPVDMQVVVHKVQDIHPAKQSVVSKQDNDLAQVQNAGKEEVSEKQQTVLTSEETRHNIINNDRNNSENRQFSKSNKKKKDDEDEDEEKTPKKVYGDAGIHFDMKI